MEADDRRTVRRQTEMIPSPEPGDLELLASPIAGVEKRNREDFITRTCREKDPAADRRDERPA